MPSILDIIDVTKVYGTGSGRTNALDGVSLSINQGEVFALLGVNGAGKTTLSSILATLHPPTSGDVLYNGASLYTNVLAYRKILGFCPQHPNLDNELNVEENLLFAGRYFLLPEDKTVARTKELLAQLDLTQYTHSPIMSLSGGTKQRVLIARALIHEPKILILDEPTVGLDPDIRRQLWQIIKDLRAKGITIILTTHYLEEAEILSDRVCILDKGKVVLIETVAALKEAHKMDTLEEVFLALTKKKEV